MMLYSRDIWIWTDCGNIIFFLSEQSAFGNGKSKFIDGGIAAVKVGSLDTVQMLFGMVRMRLDSLLLIFFTNKRATLP